MIIVSHAFSSGLQFAIPTWVELKYGHLRSSFRSAQFKHWRPDDDSKAASKKFYCLICSISFSTQSFYNHNLVGQAFCYNTGGGKNWNPPQNQALGAHLSKGPSYLKQKCTQHPTPFSGTVFNALSLGVIHFFRSVSLRNHFLVGWNSSTANQKHPFLGF